MARAKKIILGIAIAILFTMFVAYAIETFYPSPKYEKYCPTDRGMKNYYNQTECEADGGLWNEYPANDPKPVLSDGTNATGYCDAWYTCQKEYNEANNEYNKVLFFIVLILGIATVVLSFIFKVETVSSGFMAGGVLLMIYGTIRYWNELSNIWRTLMIGLALAILVWIGYKKLNDSSIDWEAAGAD